MKPAYLSTVWHFQDEPHTVDFKCYPGLPGAWYKHNGDPGDPPEPAEVEILGVYRQLPRNGGEACDVTEMYADELVENEIFLELAWAIYESAMCPPEP